MAQSGVFNSANPVETFGFKNLKNVYYNLTAPKLYEESLRRNELVLAAGGALVAETGAHTGRSAKDKFVVRDETTEKTVWWDNNGAITPANFDALYADFLAHAEGKDLFVQDLFAGAEPAAPRQCPRRYRICLAFAVHPEPADPAVAGRILQPYRRPDDHRSPLLPRRHQASRRPQRDHHRGQFRQEDRADRRHQLRRRNQEVGLHLSQLHPAAPGHHADALLGQCRRQHDSAVFFGLSGTGKTTLSADASRTLIGDDEHGWSKEGVFNFEGGCYAKAIKLSREAEPEIFATTERFGTVMENVVLDAETRVPDFDDGSKTENTRIAYPLDFIPNASATGRAPHPKNIVLLTCDAFGVLPPISKLDASQAMYHFLSGYTAKVAGTEKGVTEPSATFSTCFGAPFMPRHPSEYGNLLRDLIAKHHVDCWLVNTGWTGGKYGVGRRMPIRVTRRLLAAALDGSLNKAEFRTDPYFGLAVPTSVPGVEPHILNPGQDLGLAGRIRRNREKAGEIVPRQFRHLRAACRRQGQGSRPGGADRGRVSSLPALHSTKPRLATGGAFFMVCSSPVHVA